MAQFENPGLYHFLFILLLSQVSASNARMGKLPAMSRVQLSFRRRGSTAEETTQVRDGYFVLQGVVFSLFLRLLWLFFGRLWWWLVVVKVRQGVASELVLSVLVLSVAFVFALSQ